MQASDPTKQEFYWMRELSRKCRNLYHDGVNIDSNYYIHIFNTLFSLIYNLTKMFGTVSFVYLVAHV